MPAEAIQIRAGVPAAVTAPLVRQTDRYFHTMSLVLLAIVLAGFSRTFFLRPMFHVPPIPWYVYVHGTVMAAWIVLLVTQTSLIAMSRPDLHRRLGVFGAILAIVVVAFALALTLTIPTLYRTGVASPSGSPLPFALAYQIMWGNFGSILLFATMVPAALWMRQRPDVHKRLLLLASFTMAGPAMGRIAQVPDLWGFSGSLAPITAILHASPVIVSLSLPLTLLAHDLIVDHRLHRATLWGVCTSLVIGIGIFHGVIPATALGRSVWEALLLT